MVRRFGGSHGMRRTAWFLKCRNQVSYSGHFASDPTQAPTPDYKRNRDVTPIDEP